MNTVNNETTANYTAGADAKQLASEDRAIAKALRILSKRAEREIALTSAAATREYLTVRNNGLEHEVFGLMILDNQHKVIRTVDLFRGTIDGAAVYPREVIKTVLADNGAAVILFHNHPSGMAEPSQADIAITKRLVDALKAIDVRVLDHIIVAGGATVSFAERGLI